MEALVQHGSWQGTRVRWETLGWRAKGASVRPGRVMQLGNFSMPVMEQLQCVKHTQQVDEILPQGLLWNAMQLLISCPDQHATHHNHKQQPAQQRMSLHAYGKAQHSVAPCHAFTPCLQRIVRPWNLRMKGFRLKA